jgi:hypothetical protein
LYKREKAVLDSRKAGAKVCKAAIEGLDPVLDTLEYVVEVLAECGDYTTGLIAFILKSPYSGARVDR